MTNVQTCKICGGTSFEIADGKSFCKKCFTQNINVLENTVDERFDPTTRNKYIKQVWQQKTEKPVEINGWTSWELYNLILHGITNEAIELGATPEIKLTVLQLWATYLGKIEVAFTSTKKKSLPKLARKFHKRDAEILYGRIQQRKRRKRKKGSMSASSMESSFQSSGSFSSKSTKKTAEKVFEVHKDSLTDDSRSSFSGSQSLVSLQSTFSQSSTRSKIKFNKAARKQKKRIKEMSKKVPHSKRRKYLEEHVTSQYKLGPQVLTPMKLWVILYLALRIHDQNIHLSDMLRYGREGHLSYYKLDNLLPPEVSLSKKDIKMLSQTNEMTHKGFRRVAAGIAKFLDVELDQPDFLHLIENYCQELQLPRGILLYTEKLMALAPPKMIFNDKSSCTPNYEGRAIAFIIVVMKILFGMDGITEYEISRVAEKINRMHNSSIIVHGGVGESDDSVMIEKMVACQKAASVGYKILMKGRTASEAAAAALSWFEDDEYFNCGYGSVLNEIGEVQMDASMMDGSKFEIGSVAAVSDIEHPISLAKYIMEKYPNTILVGEGARRLAKRAGLNLVSKGNMIAPASSLAYKVADTGDFQAENFNFESCGVAEAFQNTSDTVGCVIWDGHSIVSAASSGGLNRKLVGRVGDSPLLGCGVFANDRLGCCLTGHGESAIKLGLSRAIASNVLEGQSLSEALQSNLDDMHTQTGYDGGGIALQKCGCWSACVTGTRMPYAFIRHNLITYGVDKGEKRTKQYDDAEKEDTCRIANEREVLLSRLFSFREWQRFIECRRSILSDVHFPTKLRYDPEAPGNTHLYLRFLGIMQAKKEGEQLKVTDYKNTLPELLSNGFKTCFDTLNKNLLPVNEITVFTPSTTPQHSYIQQLLNDPLNDLPDILRINFFETKVGYTTKPELLQELAAQCDIKLTVVDTSLHFIEKKVSEFEQPRIPSVQVLSEKVIFQDCNGDTDAPVKSENLFDYLHRKTESKITVDNIKKKYYDNVKIKCSKGSDLTFSGEFSSNQVSENGGLLVSVDSDSENENLTASASKVNLVPCEKNSVLKDQFCKTYNLSLSKHEQKSALRPANVLSKRRHVQKTFERNAQGKFVRNSKPKPHSEKQKVLGTNISGELKEKSAAFISEDDNVNKNHVDVYDSDISILKDFNENSIFRPFKDYWMYNCIFSRVKPKNFELFEKELPASFRWLLRECADVTEMSTEDLYEEICLIEAFYSHIFNSQSEEKGKKDSIKKSYRNTILNKW